MSTETTFSVPGPDGRKRIFRVMSALTIEDLVLTGMKAVAAEIAFAVPYVSPYRRSTRDYLIQSRITTGV